MNQTSCHAGTLSRSYTRREGITDLLGVCESQMDLASVGELHIERRKRRVGRPVHESKPGSTACKLEEGTRCGAVRIRSCHEVPDL